MFSLGALSSCLSDSPAHVYCLLLTSQTQRFDPWQDEHFPVEYVSSFTYRAPPAAFLSETYTFVLKWQWRCLFRMLGGYLSYNHHFHASSVNNRNFKFAPAERVFERTNRRQYRKQHSTQGSHCNSSRQSSPGLLRAYHVSNIHVFRQFPGVSIQLLTTGILFTES